MKQFLLRAWGKDQDRIAKAFPPDAIERDGNVLCWWFATRDARDAFESAIHQIGFVVTGAVDGGYDEFGELIDPHKRTYAHVTLRLPDGREGSFRDAYGHGYPAHSVEYMWREGNCSCDCNKRLYLARECGIGSEDDEIPCGDTIELVALEVSKGEPA